jgi:hypothetical protein
MRLALFLALVGVAGLPQVGWSQGGDPLGPEFRVNTYTPNSQRVPSVGSDSSGNFVVVWSSYQQDGSSYGVFGQRFASSGVPMGPEFRVNTYTTGNQYIADVSSGSSGSFVVVWADYGHDGSFTGVVGQRYAGSGAPLGTEFRVNTYTTAEQGFPSIASASTGNFVVVWQSLSQDGSQEGIFGQRYAASGTPLGPEFRVNTYTTNAQDRPVVASDPSGNFVVVWISAQQDGSVRGIFGRRFASSGAPLGSEFRVNTYTTSHQRAPSVASDAAGNFVVVWSSYTQDGSNYGVFGQRFASSGSPVGPEFRVNTYTTNYQSRPAVTSDDSGNFIIVWEGNLQDGSGYGVFAQRYGQIVPVELMDLQVE